MILMGVYLHSMAELDLWKNKNDVGKCQEKESRKHATSCQDCFVPFFGLELELRKNSPTLMNNSLYFVAESGKRKAKIMTRRKTL